MRTLDRKFEDRTAPFGNTILDFAAARRKQPAEQCLPMTSSLTDLAIAADQEFWKIKVAHLDSQFPLSTERYDAIFLLGILYPLKKPFCDGIDQQG